MNATAPPPARRAITPVHYAALAVKNESERHPIDISWRDGGGAIPAKSLKDAVKRMGWPNQRVEIEMPVSTENPRIITGPVVIVPETWLRRLAEILELPWETACRGIVKPE